MVTEIRLYIEGGGDEGRTKNRFRAAFGQFLKELRNHAREKRIRWNIVMCGGRSSAFDDYKTALKSHPNALNLLLVDAEAPVNSDSPWDHLKKRPGDEWDNPGVDDKQCHLMVQTMEAWLIADREKLEEYYGQHFQASALPNNANVETVGKDTLAKALKQATRKTTKGEYHKTRHAPAILERIRPDEVRSKASFCDRLFRTVLEELNQA